MKNFSYYRPTTPDAAVALLDKTWGTAELLGGGTDLLDLQKEYIAQPSRADRSAPRASNNDRGFSSSFKCAAIDRSR